MDSMYSMVFASGAALAMSLYVFWGGPQSTSGGGKGRRRRSHPPGLFNVGNSCFVNAVLQALAPCVTLNVWLRSRSDYVVEKEDRVAVTIALLKTLDMLNNKSSEEEPSSIADPELFFKSIRDHGWVLDTQEQDAHEMLHILLTSLEEECQAKERRRIQKSSSFNLMSDLLNQDENMLSDDDDEEFFHRASSPPASPTIEENKIFDVNEMSTSLTSIGSTTASPKMFRRGHSRRSSGVFTRAAGEIALSDLSSQEIDQKALMAVDANQRRSRASSRTRVEQTPFCGTLTNKVTYSDGRARSPVSASSFNNITLSLPRTNLTIGGIPGEMAVSVETLLHMFVSKELISSGGGEDTSSSKEERKRQSLIQKQMNFGRLPACLCLHIQRTAYDRGFPSKRNDFVAFNEILDMEKYVYASRASKEESFFKPPNEQLAKSKDESMNLLYKLKSVVVHLGAINSGHYVTYRRGPMNPQKWFYTSDAQVEETDLSVVLKSHAYMLFYERI